MQPFFLFFCIPFFHIQHPSKADPPTTIFLLSMRAGAVGINLTQANHVFIMDPCLNVALEDQVYYPFWVPE